MICSRILAGVDQSILRSTRNPLLNQEDSKCTTSRSSAARSLLPFIRESRSARIATSSPSPATGFAFGEPDDRPLRGIQSAAADRLIIAASGILDYPLR